MNNRCGKTAQCYDDLLKMVQNKDISTIVLFSKFEQEHKLYKQQYVDKLNARIHKAIEYIEHAQNFGKEKVIYVNGDDLLDILRGDNNE